MINRLSISAGKTRLGNRVRRRRRRILVETLEARCLLAANLLEAPCWSAPAHDVISTPAAHAVFAPGTPREYIDQFEAQLHATTGNQADPLDPIQLQGRWTSTVTDGGGLQQGDPTTLTWSIVPDGTTIPGRGGEASEPSDLVEFLGEIYGVVTDDEIYDDEPWFELLQRTVDRWSQLSGLTYLYEPRDDGAIFINSPGQLGTRGDVRLGGRFIDGNSNVLAYNYYPSSGGDMVIDTDDNFYENIANDSIRLRNVLAHELGHGIGLAHVDSTGNGFLMNPFINTSFDGPQYDDILGAHRHYGDFHETIGNDSVAAATSLGTVTDGNPLRIGGDAATSRVEFGAIDFVSIDDDSDIDVYAFEVPRRGDVEITLTPIGPQYRQGPQDGQQTLFDAAAVSDLTLELIDIDGDTVLEIADVTGRGVAEVIDGFRLSQPGTYYARVSGAANNAQTYRLDLSIEISDVPQPVIRGPGNPTNNNPLDLTIDFGEQVTGFELNEISITNGNVTQLVDQGGGLFTATVDVFADGEVTAAIAAGVAQDADNKPNDASPPFRILVDTIDPSITAPDDLRIEADAAGGASINHPRIASFLASAIASDTADLAPRITTDAPPVFPLGPTVVTFTATDHAGNTDVAQATVTVVDETPPQISLPPDSILDGNVTGGASISNKEVAAFLARALADDIVDGSIRVTHDGPNVFPLGQTQVTFTARDQSGNEAVGTATLTIEDITPPTVFIPASIVVEAETVAGVPQAHPRIAEFLTAANAIDVVSDSVTITHDAPDQFPIGDTVVIFTAIDGAGNQRSKAATVTVRDSTPPVMRLPAGLVLEADSLGGAGADHTAIGALLAAATASDTIDTAVRITHDAPLTFPVGETIITFVASDDFGNQTAGSVTVLVVDTVGPTIDVPPQVVVEANTTDGFQITDQVIDSILAATTTNDTVASSVTVTYDLPSAFPLGDNVVTLTAIDQAGNRTSVSTILTVQDTTAPRIRSLETLVVEADTIGGAVRGGDAISAWLASAQATDIVDPNLEISHDAPPLLPLGRNLVTFTSRDRSGNRGVATAVVQVVDTTPPSIELPPDLTVVMQSTDDAAGTTALIRNYLASIVVNDTVDPAVRLSSDAPASFPLGETLVSYVATDKSGNRWNAVAMITVMPAVDPAVVSSPANPLDVNGDGEVTALDALNIINSLSINSLSKAEWAKAELESNVGAGWSRFDVNRNGVVSAADALLIINRIGKPGESQATDPLSRRRLVDAALLELTGELF
jgi:hypothetical protein